jgi:uncharacterized protein YutE (UPF0331/DUF86 family)
MPKPELIRKRLQKLDEYLAILRKLRRYNLEEFVSDPEHYGSAERFMQLAIEVCNGLGNHIVADLDLGPVDSYADVPALLFEHGYVDDSLRQTWMRMIGFRNILVHDYLLVDRAIVHSVLKNDLDDFERLKRMFAQFM